MLVRSIITHFDQLLVREIQRVGEAGLAERDDIVQRLVHHPLVDGGRRHQSMETRDEQRRRVVELDHVEEIVFAQCAQNALDADFQNFEGRPVNTTTPLYNKFGP